MSIRLIAPLLIAFVTLMGCSFTWELMAGRLPNVTHRTAYGCGAVDRQRLDAPSVTFPPMPPHLRALCDAYRQGDAP